MGQGETIYLCITVRGHRGCAVGSAAATPNVAVCHSCIDRFLQVVACTRSLEVPGDGEKAPRTFAGTCEFTEPSARRGL